MSNTTSYVFDPKKNLFISPLRVLSSVNGHYVGRAAYSALNPKEVFPFTCESCYFEGVEDVERELSFQLTHYDCDYKI